MNTDKGREGSGIQTWKSEKLIHSLKFMKKFYSDAVDKTIVLNLKRMALSIVFFI